MPYIAVGQFVVRASGDPLQLVAPQREIVTSGDSQLAVTYVDPMRTMMARTVAHERYRARLSSAFGAAAGGDWSVWIVDSRGQRTAA
jgi:hypothetical protein